MNTERSERDVKGAEFRVLARALAGALDRVGSITAELHSTDTEQVTRIAHRLEDLDFSVSVLEPPLHYRKDGVHRIRANGRKVLGLRRVKLLLFALYSVAGILLEFWPCLYKDNLKFLYAVRSNPAER